MTWWGWILLALYLIGYPFAFRRIAGQLAWCIYAAGQRAYPAINRDRRRPDGGTWFGAIALAVVLCLVWPMSWPIAVGISFDTKGSNRFYVPPRERERIYRERIAALERETGIR